MSTPANTICKFLPEQLWMHRTPKRASGMVVAVRETGGLQRKPLARFIVRAIY
jgi:hypothetical protein